MSETSTAMAAMDTEMRGAVPDSVVEYASRDGELFDAYLAWRSSILDTGVIPRTQKLLMVIALLTAQKDIDPLKMYAGIARSEGATGAQIKEALRVGILFSGGAGVAAAANVASLLDES
jgi:alkylhydroperoxidase/carboxymuconolactone decarboxylase family protein YurZ